jgi:hypothetical protein
MAAEDRPTNDKRDLLRSWLRIGNVLVHFDSGHPEAVVDCLATSAHAWVLLSACSAGDSGVIAQGEFAGKKQTILIPWEAIHTMQSSALDQAHVWISDLSGAEDRHDSPREELLN